MERVEHFRWLDRPGMKRRGWYYRLQEVRLIPEGFLIQVRMAPYLNVRSCRDHANLGLFHEVLFLLTFFTRIPWRQGTAAGCSTFCFRRLKLVETTWLTPHDSTSTHSRRSVPQKRRCPVLHNMRARVLPGSLGIPPRAWSLRLASVAPQARATSSPRSVTARPVQHSVEICDPNTNPVDL